MAFSKDNFELVVETGRRSIYSVDDAGSTLVDIGAAGYLGAVVADGVLEDGDLVICTGSDGTGIRVVTNASDAANITLVALG